MLISAVLRYRMTSCRLIFYELAAANVSRQVILVHQKHAGSAHLRRTFRARRLCLARPAAATALECVLSVFRGKEGLQTVAHGRILHV